MSVQPNEALREARARVAELEAERDASLMREVRLLRQLDEARAAIPSEVYEPDGYTVEVEDNGVGVLTAADYVQFRLQVRLLLTSHPSVPGIRKIGARPRQPKTCLGPILNGIKVQYHQTLSSSLTWPCP